MKQLTRYQIIFFHIVVCMLVSGTIIHQSYGMVINQDPQSKVRINVSYANNTSNAYTIITNANQNYTITQQYSWADDNSTRFNLQGYVMDDGPTMPIQRMSQGNFTLNVVTNTDHSIVFLSKPQFKIITTLTNKINFIPPSPTKDYWFDADSDIQISAPYVLHLDQNNTRKQLSGWLLDSSVINDITRHESGTFKSHVIHISSMHKTDLVYSTQYYVKAVTNFGKITGSGWYDSGTIAYVSIIIPTDEVLVKHIFAGWQGPVIGSHNQESVGAMVDSPKIIAANWLVDYTNVSIIGIIAIAIVVLISIYQKRRVRPNYN